MRRGPHARGAPAAASPVRSGGKAKEKGGQAAFRGRGVPSPQGGNTDKLAESDGGRCDSKHTPSIQRHCQAGPDHQKKAPPGRARRGIKVSQLGGSPDRSFLPRVPRTRQRDAALRAEFRVAGLTRAITPAKVRGAAPLRRARPARRPPRMWRRPSCRRAGTHPKAAAPGARGRPAADSRRARPTGE